MKQQVLAAVLVLASGCSAASTALGALGSKPPQATVVNNNNISVPVSVGAPATPATPAAAKPRATPAIVTGGLSGAVLGGATAVALHASTANVALGALGGAAAGSLVGYVVHAIE